MADIKTMLMVWHDDVQEEYEKGDSASPEDKQKYLDRNVDTELAFAQFIAKKLGHNLIPNPDHMSDRLDYINVDTGRREELKTQTTPFYTSKRKFDIPTQNCVTLNVSDVVHWKERKYSSDIVLWMLVLYPQSFECGIPCPAVIALYKTSIGRIFNYIADVNPIIHYYKNRRDRGDGRDSRGNKCDSYALDVSKSEYFPVMFREER